MSDKKRFVLKHIIAAVIVTAFVAAVVAASLFYFGVVHFNKPDPDVYPVVGVDVSCYQGDIDWQTLAGQNIRFAFIKATEGSSLVDPNFEYNFAEASKTGLLIGAYHFFSFESSGEKQAEVFCATVKPVPDMLPPVLDVEYYGRFSTASDIDLPKIKEELRTLADALTDRYGVKPIIYCDERTYADFVKDGFSDCGLWYRSVYSSPPSDVNWTFWQYSNRQVLDGYHGRERYIDMNVFFGDPDAFYSYSQDRQNAE